MATAIAVKNADLFEEVRSRAEESQALIRTARSVTASLDLQNPKDDATGKLLPRRAREHGAIRVLQQAGPVQIGAEVVASSLRYDDAENARTMGGYGILNLTLEWPFTKGLSLLLRGDNVFDKNYQLAADFSTGGATFYAGLRWQP
jgi:vitamin B12 transporter